MKLDARQIQAAEELLRIAERIAGVNTQEALAGRLSSLSSATIASADLSKLRRGYLPDSKWQDLLRAFERVLGANGAVSSSDAAAVTAHLDELKRDTAAGSIPNLESLLADPSMRSAYYSYLWGRDQNDVLWDQTEAMDLEVTWGSYSSIDRGLRSLHDALGAAVRAAVDSDPNRGYQLVPSQYSELYRWLTAQSAPLICLYPFFLTFTKRSAWGCIRYGWQRRIGVLAPEFLLNGTPDVITPRNFARLLVDSPTSPIEHLAGYSVEEIVFEMLATFKDAKLINRFRNTLTHNPAEGLAAALERLSSTSIFVFDLEHREAVRKGLSQSSLSLLAFRELSHEREIPVGIGFSLPALPWLAERKRFEAFRSAASGALAPFRNELNEQLGLEIDQHSDDSVAR